MGGRLASVLLVCMVVQGCAQTPDSDPIGAAFSDCVSDAAVKQAESDKTASPKFVDAPGGPCEAQRGAYFQEMKQQEPTWTDKELNSTLDDIRNAIWRYTMNHLGN